MCFIRCQLNKRKIVFDMMKLNGRIALDKM
jgi:hypothetical protein